MWNGTMFVDHDWPLNASSLLSASADLLVLANSSTCKFYCCYLYCRIPLLAKSTAYITLNFHYLQIQPPFTAKFNYLQIQRPRQNVKLKVAQFCQFCTQFNKTFYFATNWLETKGLSRTVSEINGDFSRKSKICKIIPTRVFWDATEEVPLGIGYRR